MEENGNGNGNGNGLISNIITNIIVALLILIGTALIAIDGFLANQVWNNNESITELKSTAASRKEINDAKFKEYDTKLDEIQAEQVINTATLSALRAEVTENQKQIARITDVDITNFRSELDSFGRQTELNAGRLDAALSSYRQQQDLPGKHP